MFFRTSAKDYEGTYCLISETPNADDFVVSIADIYQKAVESSKRVHQKKNKIGGFF
jgi:hypothetical protein